MYQLLSLMQETKGLSGETFRARCKITGGDSVPGTRLSRLMWKSVPKDVVQRGGRLREIKSRPGEFMEENLRITEYLGIAPDSGRL